MLFRRLILLSLCVGFLAGAILTLAQQFQSTAIILQSEQYEVVSAPAETAHSDSQQQNDDEAKWVPEEGIERLIYSLLSNVLTAMGYSAILLAIMVYYQLTASKTLGLAKGAFFGLLGYATFFVAPSLGLPPEIPGTEAATLAFRQLWWGATVITTGLGFMLVLFKPSKYRALYIGLGAVLLLLPHLIGAPKISGAEFFHPDPAVVETLMQLHHQFIIAVSIVNFIFWLTMGLFCAWVLARWVFNDRISDEIQASAS